MSRTQSFGVYGEGVTLIWVDQPGVRGRRGARTWGIVNLRGRCSKEIAKGRAWPGLACELRGGGHTGDRPPGGETLGAGLVVGGGGQAMAAGTEVAGDGTVGGEEALGVAGRLEASHASFPLPGGLVGILRPVIESFVSAVLDTRQDFTLGRAIAGQLVGDHHARHVGEILEQTTEELLGGRRVSAALDQDIEDVAVLIDGPPEIVLHPVDADEDLVEVPLVTRLRAPASQRVGVLLAERAAPLAHGLVGEDHPALGEQFLHVAITQGEAEGQPDRVADNLGRVSLALVGGGSLMLIHAPSIARPSGCSLLDDTSRCEGIASYASNERH